MKNKLIAILVVIMILIAMVPVHSYAVDPVSAATMANALAQAITAYGASQGVSMTFDVTNTDGIGEGVKELWDNFKADMESDPNYSGPTIQTYDTMSVSSWATLYKKIGNKVGIDITAEVKSVFDGFWNWLLSGPAEMTKVDNQYYQWTIDNETVNPIVVYKVNDIGVPLPYLVGEFADIYPIASNLAFRTNFGLYKQYNRNVKNNIFSFRVGSDIYFVTNTGESSGASILYPYNGNINRETVAMNSIYQYSSTNFRYGLTTLPSIETYYIHEFNSFNDGIVELYNLINNIGEFDKLSVQPYVGDNVPQDVYIPDNQDVNYQPIPVSIPLDINWDDTIYGDGTDTLTDAQAQEIADTLDNAITENPAKTLELADTVTHVPDPTEVYIPFLPVELPNFEFSLSGIWHYVRDWVASIGSWFSLVFTIWSHLPYAIVVPVYASAVIVIVLGVYRRFFM